MRIIGQEGEWVRSLKHGGIIRVPTNYVWAEYINPDLTLRDDDSLECGPINKNLIIGKAVHILWPYWRYESVASLE